MTLLRTLLIACVSLCALAPSTASAGDGSIVLDAGAWKFVDSQSGPTNYYSTGSEGGVTFLHSKYQPPMKTAVMGWKTPEGDRSRVRKISWSWRALTLPNGGDECASGKGDSAAVVYVTWKRGLRYYTIKYVWSAVGTKGKTCDQKRNPFVAQDTTIVESGAPLNTWKTVSIDLATEFRNHFEGGDPKAEIPDFVGIGLMSDGDNTKSDSSADFGTFTVDR